MGYTWLPGLIAVLIDVEPFEVMRTLTGPGRRWPHRVTGPGGIPLLGIRGRSETGRAIVVFVRHDDGLDWTIVGARPMTSEERAEYEEWETS